MDNSYSSEDPGAGGFLIGEGQPKIKPTKQNSHYRHTELMAVQRCGNCVMFHAPERGAMTGECDLGWNAQRNYVCDHWESKNSPGTLNPDKADPAKRGIQFPHINGPS